MALRNQPYLPLYVQDFMSDEKLRECSAESVGVYIFLMCVMHKSEEYGKIILTDKYISLSKTPSKTQADPSMFAYMLAKHLPYTHEVIERSLTELLREKVIQIEENTLIQKRMVRDCRLSSIRALAGSKGGKNRVSNQDNFAQAKGQAKGQASSESEYVIENENENEVIPYDQIFNLFGDICKSIPKVKVFSKSRKEKLKTRWAEMPDIKQWEKLFEAVEASSFLKGDNKNNWKCTFDWLIENDKNYLKVLEGNYNSKRKSNVGNFKGRGVEYYEKIAEENGGII